MKYCRYCGSEIADEAVICVHCGKMVNEQPVFAPQQKSGSGINVICLLAFIFSFITSLVGIILGIIGYNQVKNTPDTTSKNIAKAGIIISIVKVGISVLLLMTEILFLFLVVPSLIHY